MSHRFPGSRRFALVLAALAALCLAGAAAQAGVSQISAADDASRPFVVKIHADWCMTCLMLDVTWAELGKRLGLHARLVVLDVTNPETRKVARAEAERLGMLPFFERYRSRTGAVGVLHGVSRQTVTVLLGELDAGRYEAAVKEAATKEAS